MTVTNTKPVKSFNRFFAYMVEAESHNGVDERFVMSRTRGPISLGSARRDFTRLMTGKNREVEAIATLHSSAPGECETIAAQLEQEQGLESGSIDKHDPEVIERYVDMVVASEDEAAPGTAGVYVAQVDGEHGLLHVHGMRLNVMMRDVEVPVMRRAYETEADGKTIARDAQGRRVPKRDAKGSIVYEQTVEKVKAGAALPPSMRDSLRARKKVDEVWLEHGIDNEKIVSPRPRRGAPRQKGHTYEDRARAYLDALEARREGAMTLDDIVTAIKADGHGAELRGKKRPVLTFDFVEDGAHHRIRTQRLSTPERDYSLEALVERMGVEPVVETPVVIPVTPTVEIDEEAIVAGVMSDLDTHLDGRRSSNAEIIARRRAARARAKAEDDELLAKLRSRHEAPETPTPVAQPVEAPAAVEPVEDEPEDVVEPEQVQEDVQAVYEVVETPWMRETREWLDGWAATSEALLADPTVFDPENEADADAAAWTRHQITQAREFQDALTPETVPAEFWDTFDEVTGPDAEEAFLERRREDRAQRQSVVVERAHEEFEAEVARINAQSEAEKVVEDVKAEAKPLSQLDRDVAAVNKEQRRLRARKDKERVAREAAEANGQNKD